LKTLQRSAGRFRFAAQKLGVTAEQLKDYCLLRPELQAALGDSHEELLDHAETILYSEISAFREWAIKFVLLTLGRSRGFVKAPRERRRRTGEPSSDGEPSPVRGRVMTPSVGQTDSQLPGNPNEESALTADAKLRAEISARQRWAIRFVLTKLGKSRGYVQGRPEPPAPKPIGVPDLSRLTPEERAEYEQLLAIARGNAPSGSAAPAGTATPPSSGAAALPDSAAAGRQLASEEQFEQTGQSVAVPASSSPSSRPESPESNEGIDESQASQSANVEDQQSPSDSAMVCGMPRSYFLNPEPLGLERKVMRFFGMKKRMVPVNNKHIRILPIDPKNPRGDEANHSPGTRPPPNGE
jgi:hypothetical protein